MSLLEDSGWLSWDEDMAGSLSTRYSPEYSSSFHCKTVRRKVPVLSEVAFPAFDISLFDFETLRGKKREIIRKILIKVTSFRSSQLTQTWNVKEKKYIRMRIQILFSPTACDKGERERERMKKSVDKTRYWSTSP